MPSCPLALVWFPGTAGTEPGRADRPPPARPGTSARPGHQQGTL